MSLDITNGIVRAKPVGSKIWQTLEFLLFHQLVAATRQPIDVYYPPGDLLEMHFTSWQRASTDRLLVILWCRGGGEGSIFGCSVEGDGNKAAFELGEATYPKALYIHQLDSMGDRVKNFGYLTNVKIDGIEQMGNSMPLAVFDSMYTWIPWHKRGYTFEEEED